MPETLLSQKRRISEIRTLTVQKSTRVELQNFAAPVNPEVSKMFPTDF